MRTGFALALALALGACGADGSGDDAPVPPDGSPPPEPDLKLVSPEIDIQPGQDVTFCWYFRTPNTRQLAIKRWQSTMAPGAHHLIVFTSKADIMPPGMVSTVDCNPGAGIAGFPTWMYAAQDPEAEVVLPADDGEGKPVAVELPANQAGFIQMHFTNRTDTVLKSRVTVNGYALAEGVAYTKSAGYTTFNANISIPPMATGDVEAQTCNVPTTSKFWIMTMHAHKQAVRTAVRDGMPATGSIVFESRDWQHPGASRWNGPFYTFGSGKLTYECEYDNPSPTRPIEDGESAQSDEMCMASGYFFPATQPVFCYNSNTF